ncbi:MAG: gliding motility-associated C-terminal domain-containing protein [Bacteroidota bacterium]
MKKIFFYFLAIIAILSPHSVIAQTATLSGSPMNLFGWTFTSASSHLSNDTFVLTDPIVNQAGAITYNTPVSLDTQCYSHFSVVFSFKMSNPASGSNYADGLAFWFFNSSTISPLTVGPGIGLPVNPIGLALVLDQHDDDGNNNNPLISLRYFNGNGGYIEGTTNTALNSDLSNQPFINDGAWHSCDLEYNGGSITVSFDGVPAMTGFKKIELTGFWGFSASTGSGYSKHEIRDVFINWSVGLSSPPTVPAPLYLCQYGPAATLSATGTNLKWYTSPSGGIGSSIAPTVGTTIANTYTYYVSQTVPSCGGESPRVPVYAVVTAKPTANAGNDTAVCINTLLQLHGNGGGTYKWLPATGLNYDTLANPTVNVNSPLNYALVVTTFGCRDTDSIHITLHPSPVANAGHDTVICTNTGYSLSGSGGISYLWTPAISLSNVHVGNPIIVLYDTSIHYSLTVTNSFGCTNTDSVVVAVSFPPRAYTGGDTSACKYHPLQLLSSGVGTIHWSPNTGLSNSNIANPLFIDTVSRSYSVIVTNVFGCTDTGSVHIYVYPNPVAYAGADTMVCPDVPAPLHGSGGVAYNWWPTANLSNANTASPTVNLNVPTTFYMSVTNGYGCKDTDSVRVLITPTPNFNIVAVPKHCIGDSVQLRAYGGDSYLWTPGTGLSSDNIANPMTGIDHDTVYTVVITEQHCNRSDTLSVNVKVDPMPDIHISKTNDISCIHASSTLNTAFSFIYPGNTNFTYKWKPSWGLDDSAASAPIAQPNITTAYQVTVIDDFGCSSTDSTTVTVRYDDSSSVFLIVPSGFTPNHDGHNDCFRLIVPGPAITGFTLKVYDRWGVEMYYSNEYTSACWDGTYNGNEMPLGIYMYVYEMQTKCGRLKGHGEVTLVR